MSRSRWKAKSGTFQSALLVRATTRAAWLFPFYYMHFSTRTSGAGARYTFYDRRLREFCEQDHELGYQLMKRVAEVLVRNLMATERHVAPQLRY